MACQLVPAKEDKQNGFQATCGTLLTGIAKQSKSGNAPTAIWVTQTQ